MTFKTKFLAGCQRLQDRLFQTAIGLEQKRAGLAPKRIEVDGVEYAFLQGGNPDGQIVVMVHGFAADKTNWLPLAMELKAQFQIIAIDLPGHGESSQVYDLQEQPLDFRLPQQAERLIKVMDALGVEKFHLMGSSMGGAIALQIAHTNRHRLHSLVLIGNAGVDGVRQSEFFQLLEIGENPLIVKKPGDMEKLLAFVMEQRPFMPWPMPAVIERITLARLELNERIFADMMQSRTEMGSPEQVLQMLQGLTMPVLVIWGAQDRVLDVSAVEVMRKQIPRVRAVILSGVGHVPMLEVPRQVSIEFIQFVRSVGSK